MMSLTSLSIDTAVSSEYSSNRLISRPRKYFPLLAKGHRERTHAPFADHFASHIGCPVEVVAGTGGDFIEHDIFRNTSAERQSGR